MPTTPNRLMLLIVGSLVGAAALGIAWLRSDDPRIEDTAGTASCPAAPETKERMGPDPERVELAPVVIEAGHTSAVGETAEHAELATLTGTKLPVSFDARGLIDAGVAKEVADGMVEIMEQVAPQYDLFVQKDLPGLRYPVEFLIATWPSLGDLVRAGKLKLEVVAVPPHRWSAPRVLLQPNYDRDKKSMSYAMSMERWVVRFEFTEKTAPNPELFAKLVTALESER